MKKNIVILTQNGFFTQGLKPHINVDLDLIISKLNKKGFSVNTLEYSELGRFEFLVDPNTIYWSGSHQNVSEKKYIHDILFARFINNNNIVPPLDTILSHENKGIMGNIASTRKLPLVEQDYINTKCDNIEKIEIPFVYKELTGAGSKGVRLVKDKKNLDKIIKKSLIDDLSFYSFRQILKNLIRRLTNRNDQANYLVISKCYCRQNYIPNLSFDFKVLVFGKNVYVLKRSVRKNDFRASGSGLFEIQSVIPDELAKTALLCKSKLDTPYCSLDFIKTENEEYKLIEFQTCHFGPYTYNSAKVYYSNGNIIGIDPSKSFEDELSDSFISYVNKKYKFIED